MKTKEAQENRRKKEGRRKITKRKKENSLQDRKNEIQNGRMYRENWTQVL